MAADLCHMRNDEIELALDKGDLVGLNLKICLTAVGFVAMGGYIAWAASYGIVEQVPWFVWLFAISSVANILVLVAKRTKWLEDRPTGPNALGGHAAVLPVGVAATVLIGLALIPLTVDRHVHAQAQDILDARGCSGHGPVGVIDHKDLVMLIGGYPSEWATGYIIDREDPAFEEALGADRRIAVDRTICFTAQGGPFDGACREHHIVERQASRGRILAEANAGRCGTDGPYVTSDSEELVNLLHRALDLDS